MESFFLVCLSYWLLELRVPLKLEEREDFISLDIARMSSTRDKPLSFNKMHTFYAGNVTFHQHPRINIIA